MSLNCIEDGEYASEFDALDSLFNVKFISDCLICWSTVLFCACLLFFAFYWFYCKYCMSAWNRRADLLQCFWGQIAFLVLMEPTGPKSCKRIDRIDYRCDSIVVLGIPLRSISSWRTGQELFTWLTSLEAFTFEVVRVLGDVEYGRKLRQYIFTYLYISLHSSHCCLSEVVMFVALWVPVVFVWGAGVTGLWVVYLQWAPKLADILDILQKRPSLLESNFAYFVDHVS